MPGLLAARVGDMTAHGNPLTPAVPAVMGSLNVLIGGQPAWRAMVDVHVCPLANGPQPHVGGFVPTGSLTVLINGMSAVRVTDKIVEAGSMNAITQGCPTVQIGA